jgi:hypothetical protein
MSASVKVMLSYDYCHFEVSLSDDSISDFDQVNELRKDAQRLADEAVRQYKVAKVKANKRADLDYEREELVSKVRSFEDIPKSEWTAQQKAMAKALEDHEYWSQYEYDYEDDWEKHQW